MGKNNPLIKANPKFKKELEELSRIRIANNLAKKQPTMAEMQELLMRTKGFKLSKEELKLKPKREDLFKLR